MKCEIEIELPEHLRDKWRPVAFRNAQAGECVFAVWSGQVHKIVKAPIAMANCLIVEPIDPRDEIKKWWPKTLGFDWITRDLKVVCGFFGDRPMYIESGGIGSFCNKAMSGDVSICYEIYGIDPPRYANVFERVWGNPWKEQQ